MDCNLLLCFVGINFVLIQALTSFNNADSKMLMKYLHRKNYQNPLSNNLALRQSPLSSIHNIGKKHDGKEIYAVVDMDVVIGRPYKPKKREPVYHGNDKYGYLRMGEKHRSPELLGINNHDSSGEGKNMKPSKRVLVSYEEMSVKTNDALNYKEDDNKKQSPGKSMHLKNNDLASAGHFLDTGKSSLVYGNLDNLGILYGKPNERNMYSNFRKSNNLEDLLNTVIPKRQAGSKKWLVVEIIPRNLRNPYLEMIKPIAREEEENKASEILEEFDDGDETDTTYRRRSKKKTNHRERDNYESDWQSKESESGPDSSTSSSDSASSSEKNPGNPFTLHKGNYKQNWMWNHVMDGDHVNINPYGPIFSDMTARGEDLLFGRKWWYFNQDDYKPMG